MTSNVREAPTDDSEKPFRIIAIIAAYNEEDIIADVVADLIRQGVMVYFLDHWSTDGTVAAVQEYLDKGVIGIEKFPAETGADDTRQAFAWEQILKRKETLARELDADWFIHHDADEFRESPWTDKNLSEAIRMVDRFGYNAIDFQDFEFRPTDDRFQPGDDVRKALLYYEPIESFNKIQIRCWKKTAATVDLTSAGGHDASFPGRLVFPMRFILRHYPIRGQAHGERKIFLERRARFVAAERARGWHVHYDGLSEGDTFVRDPQLLTRYDPDVVRLALILHHREVEALDARAREAERIANDLSAHQQSEQHLVETLQREAGTLQREVERLAAEVAASTQANQRLLGTIAASQRVRSDLEVATWQAESLAAELQRARADFETLSMAASDLRRELEETRQHLSILIGSASWRWTAPFRVTKDFLLRKR